MGPALRRAGRAVGDAPELDGDALVQALDAALAAVVELGAAEPGDKTMVDALGPAIEALRERLAAGEELEAALEAAAEAAEDGARATMPMQARKGRASYLGERSVGHQDPGATSTALIVARARPFPRPVGLMGEQLLRGLPGAPGTAAGRARVLAAAQTGSGTVPAGRPARSSPAPARRWPRRARSSRRSPRGCAPTAGRTRPRSSTPAC